MKVFASRFLEDPVEVDTHQKWKWKPNNKKAYEIFLTGRPTATTTYRSQKDNDTDRPNEGMLAI